MQLSIIIPAHNEELTLQKTVDRLAEILIQEKAASEIIIVNDNSSDRTAEIAQDLEKRYSQVKVIHRRPPVGFGLALREGFRQAKGEVIIPVMADASDDPKDVVKLFRKIKEGYDIVYGCRFCKGAKVYNYPFFKLIANRMGNWLIRFLFGIKEKDITNAFKAYKRKVIEEIAPIDSNEFDITIELPIKAEMKGFKKTSVPVNWYGRTSGVSKLRLSEMVIAYLKRVYKLYKLYKSRIKG